MASIIEGKLNFNIGVEKMYPYLKDQRDELIELGLKIQTYSNRLSSLNEDDVYLDWEICEEKFSTSKREETEWNTLRSRMVLRIVSATRDALAGTYFDIALARDPYFEIVYYDFGKCGIAGRNGTDRFQTEAEILNSVKDYVDDWERQIAADNVDQSGWDYADRMTHFLKSLTGSH